MATTVKTWSKAVAEDFWKKVVVKGNLKKVVIVLKLKINVGAVLVKKRLAVVVVKVAKILLQQQQIDQKITKTLATDSSDNTAILYKHCSIWDVCTLEMVIKSEKIFKLDVQNNICFIKSFWFPGFLKVF